jgi:uncharacterized protein YcfJ
MKGERIMKKITIVFLAVIFSVSLTGCQGNKSRVAEGALIGGLLGATAGGIVGHQSGHGGAGAGIGLAAGALTGALVGSQIEQPNQSPPANTGVNTGSQNPNQIALSEIVNLSKQGIHEDVIIDKIRLTNSAYSLSESDLTYLKEQGVSEKVIKVMQGL